MQRKDVLSACVSVHAERQTYQAQSTKVLHSDVPDVGSAEQHPPTKHMHFRPTLGCKPYRPQQYIIAATYRW